MKLNMTVVYISIMLPISLGYIQQKKDKGEKGGVYPLLLLIGLLIINYFRNDNLWRIISFQVRRLFM